MKRDLRALLFAPVKALVATRGVPGPGGHMLVAVDDAAAAEQALTSAIDLEESATPT